MLFYVRTKNSDWWKSPACGTTASKRFAHKYSVEAITSLANNRKMKGLSKLRVQVAS